jgi:hypothetical protein
LFLPQQKVKGRTKYLPDSNILRDQALADTPIDSEERFKSRALLPAMAKRLREVGPAVNVLISNNGLIDTSLISSRYGGEGSEKAPADIVLQRIGSTITISGRYVPV